MAQVFFFFCPSVSLSHAFIFLICGFCSLIQTMWYGFSLMQRHLIASNYTIVKNIYTIKIKQQPNVKHVQFVIITLPVFLPIRLQSHFTYKYSKIYRFIIVNHLMVKHINESKKFMLAFIWIEPTHIIML